MREMMSKNAENFDRAAVEHEENFIILACGANEAG